MTQASPPFDLHLSGGARWKAHLPALLVALAGIVSAWLLWRVTQSLPLAGGMATAALFGGAMVYAWRERAVPATSGEGADVADWSLARAIADAAGSALCVTDRTGRLVCANDIYCDWFGGPATPPGLPVDPKISALLAEVGRSAWRDGEAAIAGFRCNGREINGRVTRIGRFADHLLWHWEAHVVPDPVADSLRAINGWAGSLAGEAGIMAAIVTSAGTIRAANTAFALRAIGRADATISGLDFAALLRVDRRGTIRFAREREGQGAVPLRLIEVAFDRSDPAAPLLLLLIDDDGAAAEPGVAADYIGSLIASLPVGMAMVDRDGRFVSINDAFARRVGIDPANPPSFPGDIVVAEDKAALADAIRRHGGGRGTSGEIAVRLAGKPDTQLPIGLTGVRGLGDASVLLTLTGGSGGDEMRVAMEQATKMQAVGQLAGGIAHDFNNILTGILGSCDLMLARHSPGDIDYDDIQQVRSNANRAANLTRQLLAFSRQQTLRPQIVNLSDVLADVSHLLERLIGDTVKLAVTHGRGLGPVRADPVQLEQVIVNLAVNARDAMPRGGTLSIETRPVSAKEAARLAREGMPAADYSLISVSDTGTGISPDILPKIFDPFFTTKDVGKGTGLGLATVYGIVKQSGGYIFADSVPGKGTRFSIYLPVHNGPEQPERATSAPATGATSVHWGSGTILLVEDEDMVRAVADRALSRAGYTVITAANGEEGLERIKALETVDLVISDVMMPQMDGPTMMQSVRESRPQLPVLFMSGYAEEQLRKSIALPNVAFLPKPFSVAQLIEAVAAIRNTAGNAAQ